jgi:hypothetical protein
MLTILATWFLVGRIYMVCMAVYRSGETWKGLFTKRIYRQLIIEAGFFGYLTPAFDLWLEKSFPKKEIANSKTVLEKEFKIELKQPCVQ